MLNLLRTPRLTIYLFICFLSSSTSTCDVLEILKLNPVLFQFQKTGFESDQQVGILQEYLFKEMDNFPGQYGLHLSNLSNYIEVESQKENVPSTHTLEHLALHGGKLRIKGNDLLIVQGFYLVNLFSKYAQNDGLISNFVEKSRSADSTPWAKLLLALLEFKAREAGIKIGVESKDLFTLLSSTSAGKDTDPMFHFSLGQFYLHTLKESNPYRRLRLVTLEFERSRTKDPRNRGLFTHLTSLYIEIHEEMQAKGIPEPFEFEELVYRRIILIDPKNPWAHNNLAFLYCQNHVELKDALREARIANHLEKDNPLLLDTLGWALYKNGALQESERVLKQSIALDDSLADPHFHLATTYYDMKEYDLSVQHFKRCIELDPESSLAKNNLAYLYAEMDKNIEEGIELAQEAIKDNENNSAYLDTLGWLYYRQGEFEKALEYLKKAVALSPDSAESQYHLGQVYLKLNDNGLPSDLGSSSADIDSSMIDKEQNLSYAILMQTILEAKEKFLKMPGVSKTQDSMKIYYNQLIYLAQSMGDTAMIKKLAHELESFPTGESVASSSGETESGPVYGLKTANLSISSFFPREMDFYLNFGKGALQFISSRILSGVDLQIQAQGQNFQELLVGNLPEQISIYVGTPEPGAKISVYAVLELDDKRAQTLREGLAKFSEENFALPWMAEGMNLEFIHSGIYSLSGGSLNLFIAVKDRFLILSNSILNLNKIPYTNEESLGSNVSLKSTLASAPVSSSDFFLYSKDLSALHELFDEQHAKIFFKNWSGPMDYFQKIQNYVSLLHLGHNDLEEYEVISVKSSVDLESVREILESKAVNIKESMKKEQGIDLDYKLTVQEGAIAVYTKVSDLEHFIEFVLNYFDVEKNRLMNKNKKKGESDE